MPPTSTPTLVYSLAMPTPALKRPLWPAVDATAVVAIPILDLNHNNITVEGEKSPPITTVKGNLEA